LAGPGGPKLPLVEPKLRLDKWLWQARLFKTRADAAACVEDGHLRLNSQHCHKPGHGVAVGDTLTFPHGATIRVIRITALGHRRGPAVEAQTLYVDLVARAPKPPTPLE
jgi:ribosome-associated heat shock protein Hsp15